MKRVLGLCLVALLVGCCYTASPTSEPDRKFRCPPLPVTFKDSDLVGTWVAEYADSTDTLILKEDGTYKQIYDIPKIVPRFYYESGWQKWWIERRESGYLRLHMTGMRLCASVSSLCEREGGGVGDSLAVDYCERDGMRIRAGEVVLIVTGVTERNKPFTPRGIWLRHPRYDDPDAPTYHFELQQ